MNQFMNINVSKKGGSKRRVKKAVLLVQTASTCFRLTQ